MVRLALQASFNVAVRFGLTIISRAFAHARIGAVVKIRKNHSKGSRKFKSSSHPARPMFEGVRPWSAQNPGRIPFSYHSNEPFPG
jgi:hypothetical protein